MNTQTTRREILKGSLALAGLGVLGIPEWALPVLAQGETLVPFTDIPENVRWDTPPDRRHESRCGQQTARHECGPRGPCGSNRERIMH